MKIKFNYGIYQILEPLYKIVILNNEKKFNKKNKIIIEFINKNVSSNLKKFEKDFEAIEEKLYLINDLKQNENEKNFDIKELNNNFFEFFSFLINFFYNKLKYLKYSNSFFIKEILIFHRIILYWFIDKKGYKTEYLIKKFIYGKYFKNSNKLIMKSFFYFLNYKFTQFNCDNKNFSFLEHLLYYFKINSKYLKINNAFNQIIKNYSRNLNSLFEISESQKKILSKNFTKIRKLINSSKKLDIKNNEELEKYKLIETILFTKDLSKISEHFDFNMFDYFIEKNINFILLFKNNNFIIKKIPFNYYENTLIKSNLIKNQIFINLFPPILHGYIKNQIKETIFKKETNQIITVVKTYNNCINLVKMKTFLLPSFQDKLYLNCYLKFIDNNNHNCLIIDEEGYIKYFGEFFINYFGLNPKENDYENINSQKKSNIFHLLNRPNFSMSDFTDITYKMFNMSFNKFYQLVKSNSKKYKEYNKEFENNLNELKNKYKNINKIKIKLVQKNRFQSKKKDYFLLTLIMEDLIIKNKFSNNIRKHMYESTLNEDKFILKRKESQTTSSIFLFNSQENDFIIPKNKKNNFFKNYLEFVIFVYNFLLIIIVFMIYFILKHKIKTFKKVFGNIFSYRQFNDLFYYSQFYLSQKIRIKIDNKPNNIYEVYSEKLLNLNITLNITELYSFHCIDESIFFLNAYNTDFKNNLKLMQSIKEINTKMLQEIQIKDINGKNSTTTYLNFFDEYLVNYYILCNEEEFHVDLPIINQEKINEIKYLSKNQKLLYINILNYFNLFPYIKELNDISENHYYDSFNYLNKFTLWMIILFNILNFISIVFSFVSIKIIDVKIFKILKNISLISKEKIIFLKNKLKFNKKFIKDEIKTSKILENFKNLKNTSIALIEPENSKNKDKLKSSFINMQTQQIFDNNNLTGSQLSFIHRNTTLLKSPDLNQIRNKKTKRNSVIQYNTIKDYNEENIFFNENNSSKSHNKLFFIFKITFFFYFCLFLFIFIIFLPMTKKNFKITKKYLTLITLNIDLQDIAFNYFFNIRFPIYFNFTKDKIDISNIREEFFYILREYFLNIETYSYLEELKNYLNGENSCEYLVYDQADFTDCVLEVCDSLDITNSFYYIVINGIIYDLNYVYIKFYNSNRTDEDIMNYFHSEVFQLANLKYLINIMDGIYFLEETFIIPNINEKINDLSSVILQFFLCLVTLEIINYYINHFFIFKSSVDSYNVYLLLNLFFFPKKNKKNFIAQK